MRRRRCRRCGVLGLGDDVFGAFVVGHGARPGDPEDAAGEGALLAPEADAELNTQIAFFVAPGMISVGAGYWMGTGD